MTPKKTKSASNLLDGAFPFRFIRSASLLRLCQLLMEVYPQKTLQKSMHVSRPTRPARQPSRAGRLHNNPFSKFFQRLAVCSAGRWNLMLQNLSQETLGALLFRVFEKVLR